LKNLLFELSLKFTIKGEINIGLGVTFLSSTLQF